MSKLDELVRTVYPEFPVDRKVSGTPSKELWYRINAAQKCLYTPSYHLLQRLPHEIDRFIEAVRSYASSDIDASEYDWDNLNLHSYSLSNRDLALNCIKEIHAKAKNNVISCDIETRRVEWTDNKILALGFATDENTGYAIEFDAIDYECLAALQELFDDKSVTFVWHNGKFDVTRLRWLTGLDARVDEDTMLIHYVQINEKRGTHGLKDLSQIYLQAPAWEDELDKLKRDWAKRNKTKLGDFMYDMIPMHMLIPYLQKDVIGTLRLFFKLKRMVRPGSDFIYRKLIEASDAYKRVELNGLPIDWNYLEELEYELEKELADAKRVLDSIAAKNWNRMRYMIDTGSKSSPAEFNMKSPKQLKWMLEKTLGIKVDSTNKETIQGLLDEMEKNESAFANTEFLKAIQVVRQLSKWMDTYVQGIREKICGDFRLRGTFNLHGTETGRLSSSEPNLQNIPRNARIKNLIAAKPGYTIMQLDYSQAELRVLAMLSKDPFMKQVYLDGKDLHSEVAEAMFGPNYTKEQRNQAKTINFGIAYGRGPGSLSDAFGLSPYEARKLIQDWYKPMPLVKQYIQNRRGMPRRNEPCETIFGRARHFVITADQMHHIENEYINTPVQSVASDLTLFSLIEMDKYILDTGVDARIIASVHDSIVLEVLDDEELLKQMAKVCCDIMAKVPKMFIEDCDVPFKADVEVGYSWGELEAFKYED